MDRKGTRGRREPRVPRDLLESRASKDQSGRRENREIRGKLVYLDFPDQLDATDYPESVDSPDHPDRKAILARTESRARSGNPAARGTKAAKETWDRWVVLDQEDKGVRLAPLALPERKDRQD